MTKRELAPTVTAFALHGHSAEHPGSEIFLRFYSATMSLFEGLGADPTFVSAEGAGYSGDYSKIGGRVHRRMLRENFEGVSVLSIVANPQLSGDPAYNSFASCSLLFVPSASELTFALAINEAYLRFDSEAFWSAVRPYIDMFRWYTGYAFLDAVERRPELYLLGLDSGRLSDQEQARLNAWYSAPISRRLEAIRDVFPVNLLGERQLAASISDGMTLRELAPQGISPELAAQGASNLTLWRVPTSSLDETRKRLSGSAAMLP